MASRGASTNPRGRVLIAKVGLDGHESGAKLVTRLLREDGFEVIYTGMRASVPAVVRMAIDEDVDAIGLSLLSGTHLKVSEALIAGLRAEGADTPLIVGGIIPPADVSRLRELGVAAVLGPGSYAGEIVEVFRKHAQRAEALQASQGENAHE